MLETAGQKLRQAREQKKWTIPDVARATRIRPERIEDLENDEYGNFPNLSYGRNFLLLYARHLGLDPAEISEPPADDSATFGLDDYEYLHAKREPPKAPAVKDQPQRSYAPIIVAILIIGLVLALAAGFLIVTFQRITAKDTDHKKIANISEVRQELAARAEASPAEEPASAAAAAPIPSATDQPPALDDENVTVMRAVPVNAGQTPAPVENVVVLQPLQKTKVTVRQGTGENAAIVFDDFLYPNASPLTLRGDAFFIQADADGANLKITRNGVEVAYSPPGLTIE